MLYSFNHTDDEGLLHSFELFLRWCLGIEDSRQKRVSVFPNADVPGILRSFYEIVGTYPEGEWKDYIDYELVCEELEENRIEFLCESQQNWICDYGPNGVTLDSIDFEENLVLPWSLGEVLVSYGMFPLIGGQLGTQVDIRKKDEIVKGRDCHLVYSGGFFSPEERLKVFWLPGIPGGKDYEYENARFIIEHYSEIFISMLGGREEEFPAYKGPVK